MFNSLDFFFEMLYKREFYTLIFEKVPTVGHNLAEDLRQMCPLRDFAPPKLKVFRRAC